MNPVLLMVHMVVFRWEMDLTIIGCTLTSSKAGTGAMLSCTMHHITTPEHASVLQTGTTMAALKGAPQSTRVAFGLMAAGTSIPMAYIDLLLHVMEILVGIASQII